MIEHGLKTVTRERALAILARHGLTPDEPTAFRFGSSKCDTAVSWDETSSFDAECGVRETYDLAAVLFFLGY